MELTIGNTVFLSRTEEYWDKPFVMKRHHVYDTKTVILQGTVTDIRGDEFKAKLINNNNFEKDGEEFVFHKNSLLSNQNFKIYKI
jgi:hypothetical protein